jgi:hypothetical protein
MLSTALSLLLLTSAQVTVPAIVVVDTDDVVASTPLTSDSFDENRNLSTTLGIELCAFSEPNLVS